MRRPITIKVIYGLVLLTATLATFDGRGLERGTAQFMKAGSPTALDLFLVGQAACALVFLAVGLTGRRLPPRLFTACCLTTVFFVIASGIYVLGTPGTAKVALPYEGGFLALMLWDLFSSPHQVQR